MTRKRRDPHGIERAVRANSVLQQPYPRHSADATDFRTQPSVAPGGPVERIYPTKEEPVTEPRVIPADERQKPAIARELLAHADRRGWVSIEPTAIASGLGIPVHDVAHALWDFQKKGMMKFRERHMGARGETLLTALRLTTAGRAAMVAMTNEAAPATTVQHELHGEPIDSFSRADPEPDGLATGDSWRVVGKPEPADFPLIAALLERRGRLESAATLLEQAGEVEMALAAMEKAHADDLYSPLEAEHIRLWEFATR
jgi:hypothetical protein